MSLTNYNIECIKGLNPLAKRFVNFLIKFRIVISLIWFVAFLYKCSARKDIDPSGKNIIPYMIYEVSFLNPPDGSEKINEDVSSKNGSAFYSRDYISSLEKNNILKYYNERLVSNGWKFYELIGDNGVKYCKNGLFASVEVKINNNKNNFYLALNWLHGHSDVKCGSLPLDQQARLK